MNRTPVPFAPESKRVEDLIPAIRSRAVGDELTVLVLRDGKLVDLRLVMGTRPPPK